VGGDWAANCRAVRRLTVIRLRRRSRVDRFSDVDLQESRSTCEVDGHLKAPQRREKGD
jgi:hypothetical protein